MKSKGSRYFRSSRCKRAPAPPRPATAAGKGVSSGAAAAQRVAVPVDRRQPRARGLSPREFAGEVHREGGLAGPALLIHQGDNASRMALIHNLL